MSISSDVLTKLYFKVYYSKLSVNYRVSNHIMDILKGPDG